MKKQLEQYFGCKVKITEYESKLQLPIFMTMRNIKLVEFGGVKFALVNIVRESKLTWKMWYAGESALSQISGLNPPRIEETAIYKGAEIVDQFDIVDERIADNERFAKVQLWKYNPLYFARNGSVDPVSLVCSFQENEDERIEMSIEELLEKL